MRTYYTLTTLDPVIVSQTNATTNNHQCLDYIPGSAILGALAAQLYSTLDRDDSWKMFHGGDVKFGPCYPANNHQLTLPTPASWHTIKGRSATTMQHFDRSVIVNQASLDFKRTDGIQYQQCREGYVSPTAASAIVNKAIATKTAINNMTGIAEEGSLFSYSYIEPTQQFIGWIESENPTYIEKAHALLQGTLSIGRSRNTEFGRVAINFLGDMPISAPEVDKTHLTLWCLSDCECLNQQGIPTYVPELTTLIGEASGRLDAQRSFIRTTKVSRFNQRRQGLDSEQLLIRKGSVLVYELSHPLTQEQLISIEHNGLGINQHQGLGWVMVNPAWALNARLGDTPLFQGMTIPDDTPTPKVTQPMSALTRWVEAKASKQQTLAKNRTQVDALITKIAKAYRNARQYNNILNSYEVGPSSSQWRRISDELRHNNHDWKSVLFDDEHAICKANNDELGWGVTWDNGDKLVSFSDFLKHLLNNQESQVVLMLLNQMNRYDFSTFKELKKASVELGFSLSNSQDNTQEVAQ
jgi:CRISPR-associated protein Csx10